MTISAQVLGRRAERRRDVGARRAQLFGRARLQRLAGSLTDGTPKYGAVVSGKVLVMRAGRGSSSGSAVLAEALRRGTGPAAILLSERDGIVAAGAIVASRLYGVSCPVFLVSPTIVSSPRIRSDYDFRLIGTRRSSKRPEALGSFWRRRRPPRSAPSSAWEEGR